MDLQKLSLKLHPLERKVLPVLKKETEFNAITKKSGLQEIEVMRALQWLENKEIIGIHTEKKKIVLLDKNGMKYRKEGLPEKAFLTALSDEFKGLNVITKKSKLSREEVNACIGLLKRKVAIDVKKEDILNVKITEQGKKLRTEPSFEEQFLAKEFPIDLLSIQDLDKLAFDELKKRKDFLKIEEQKTVTVTLTEIGQKLLTTNLTRDVINRLTPAMLKTGSWRNKEFRAYDIEINVPTTHQGKKHFVTEAVEYITQIWLDMGFKEMSGQYVQSAFWDLDALFVPQDHPAREMQDTFYVEGEASLPPVWKKVKAVHENGGDTGSTGWKYTFSEDETKKILLRTHTTVLSAQTIANLTKDDLPAKFFSVGKVFRNEITARQFIFRTREFQQMEMQYFVQPEEANAEYARWKQARWDFYVHDLGINEKKLRWHEHENLVFYAKEAWDIEYEFPFGFSEIEGIHNRSDYDLTQHSKFSGCDLSYTDQRTKEKYTPWVVETSSGLDRALFTVLSDAYTEEK
ncbi:hypothetical protein HOH30_01840, partial [Candidatus Woesearchaeota archaeon]|nr:hypothetical protein [Candidatus Woesearchaeota archaeon]